MNKLALVIVLCAFAGLASAQPVGLSSFGIQETTYVSIGDWEFIVLAAANNITTSADEGFTQACLYPSDRLQCALHLPGGVVLTSLELNSCDTDPTADMTLKLYDMSTLNVVHSTLATIKTSGAPGCESVSVDLAPLNYTVNNKTNRLLMELTQINPHGEQVCNLSLRGAVIGYKLQVSPSPAFATFNDVPTDHPFFRFIEALKASGITGGCQANPPLYCPDNPVTRGQLAVFLAKALGL